MTSKKRRGLVGFGVLGVTIPFVFLTINVLITSSRTAYELLATPMTYLRLFVWPSSVMLSGLYGDTDLVIKLVALAMSVSANAVMYMLIGWLWNQWRSPTGWIR
jgi:hypothetical protein